MSTTMRQTEPRLRYHRHAYDFVFHALRHAQRAAGRAVAPASEGDDAHISGQELLAGIRELALAQFGLLTTTVFRHWGIRHTDDFGRIVFELVEHGKMRKTERDQLSDFYGVYDFDDVFDREYQVDTRNAFHG